MTVDCLVLTLLVAPTGCYAGAVPSTTIDVNTDVAVHVLVVDSRFLSFTLDAIELTNGFNGSSLTSTVLLKCTQALTPAYLRIGGSTEDFLRYSFGPPQHQRYHARTTDSGQQLPPPNITFAMSASAWAAVNAFAVTAGVDHVVGDSLHTWQRRWCGFAGYTM